MTARDLLNSSPALCSNWEVPQPFRRLAVSIRKWWIAGSSVFTALCLIVTLLPIDSWYARLLSGKWDYGQDGTLIVLAAEAQPDGLVGYTSYWRAVYAVRAWRNGHFERIVISGGSPVAGQKSLASVLAAFLVGSGVPQNVIWLEERSLSTHQNAEFTALLLRSVPGKKTLLTSDQHMFRAKRAFRREGVEVSAMPIPDTLKRANSLTERIPIAVGLVIETVKIAYYAARGWI